MNYPRDTDFQTFMQVPPDRIARMTDVELSQLMRELLHAQANRCGSPLSELRVNTDDKAPDGGCDAWTGKPRTKDDWLGDSDTCWQLKAGIAGQPAKLKGEVSKSIPKETLECGSRFVVVTSGSKNGEKGERDRLGVIQSEALSAGIPDKSIDVIGSERLTGWCNQHPAIALRWAGRPAELLAFDQWANMEEHQVPWQTPGGIGGQFQDYRSKLSFESDSVYHLHIYGPAGVGKTRFALELCRNASWVDFVVYVPQASEVRLSEIIGGAANDLAVRLVLVVDEINSEQLRRSRTLLEAAKGRVRLITVGHCESPEPARIPAHKVQPLDVGLVGHVIRGWHPSMPIERIDFVATFSDGYVRLAKLAADVVSRQPRINVQELLNRNEIGGFLDSLFGGNSRRCLHVLAALTRVGWTGDVDAEGKSIAEHFGLDWDDVQDVVVDLDRTHAIARRNGDYRYISPTPLGAYLACDAWMKYPKRMASLPDALPSEEARLAYYNRQKEISRTPGFMEVARKELDGFFLVNDFCDLNAVLRWSAFSTAQPVQAAKILYDTLKSTDVPARMAIQEQARRELVYTLVRLAWRRGAFSNVCNALALLAEAENETWANNATNEFISRFQVYLGGTAVPYRERLRVLDELVATGRVSLIRLAVKALVRGGAPNVTRARNAVAAEVPEQGWRPGSEAERIACVQAAIDKLSKYASLGVSELKEDYLTAVGYVAWMLRDGELGDTVFGFFETVREKYPDTRESLRREISYQTDLEREGKNPRQTVIDKLETMHRHFEDFSLRARVEQFVGEFRSKPGEQAGLREVAMELSGCPDMLDETWPWLTSGEASNAWVFGELLAENDAEEELLTRMVVTPDSDGDLRVLAGYINKVKARRGDDWYDGWVEEQAQHVPVPANLIFDVVSRCGPTLRVAECVQGMLASASEVMVGKLFFGRWGDRLPFESLSKLVWAMVDAGHEKTAVRILEDRVDHQPDEHEQWGELALRLIKTPRLIRDAGTDGYFWKELALRYIVGQVGVISDAILREQATAPVGTWCVERSHHSGEVLGACVKESREEVWEALKPYLALPDAAIRWSLGFPRQLSEQMPVDAVVKWVSENPKERSWTRAVLGR